MMITNDKMRALATLSDLVSIHRQLESLASQRADLQQLDSAIDNIEDVIGMVEIEIDSIGDM
jgi:hypothetical protein